MTDSVKNKPPGISCCQGNMSEGEGLGENTLVVLLLRFLRDREQVLENQAVLPAAFASKVCGYMHEARYVQRTY